MQQQQSDSSSDWHNFPWELPARDQDVLDAERLLYLVCVWRINTTLVLERVLRPWETEQCGEWLSYRLKLFRGTHLDLLTEMVRHGCYQDVQLYQRGLLAKAWPGAARVCCAEEMPDFICYINDNFKTGTNLKERNTRDDKFGHLFINKTAPNICKIRNSFDISIRYGEEDPLIYEALKNILRCVLLGHLPRAQGRVSVLAAVKINAFFSPEEADRELSEEQFAELTRNKSLKRKKNGEPELKYKKTFFKLWMLVDRYFMMFLLKEFMLYVTESSGCANKIRAVNYKWQRIGEIIRLGNARCRELLSRQACVTRPFDWSVIEYEKKSPYGQKQRKAAATAAMTGENEDEDGGGGGGGAAVASASRPYDVKSGEIKKFHHWSLSKTSKINKDDFAKILLKKMTGTEKKITADDLARCDPVLATEETVTPDGRPDRITLEEFDFLCWYMSLRKSNVLETRWFQVMGMSTRALAQLRHWQFLFYVYAIPDNSLNPEIEAMRERSMRDCLLMKLAIRSIDNHRMEKHVFHLPRRCGKEQAYAMRQYLRIGEYEPTPRHMGLVYQSKGCMRFACSVAQIEESKWGCHATPPPTIPSAPNAPVTPVPPQQPGSHSYLNKTFYNVENGLLYCMRNQNPYTRQNLAGPDQPMTLVMRKRDDSIRIYSNKLVPVHAPQQTVAAPRAFLFGDRYAREQTDKKLEWLMQTSAHDMLNPGDSAATNTTTATTTDAGAGGGDGTTEASTTTTTATTTTTKRGASGGNKKSDGVKKMIQQRIDEVIVRPGADCQAPLMRINIIGIAKNGKTACMQCGMLTELTNRNLTPDGAITCGNHAPPPDPPDRIATKHQLHARDLIPLSSYTMCHYCAQQWARYRLVVQAPMFALRALSLCKECFERCRSYTKGELVMQRALDQRMRK